MAGPVAVAAGVLDSLVSQGYPSLSPADLNTPMAKTRDLYQSLGRDEVLLTNMLEIGALIAMLDRKGLLSKEEVLAEIKSLQKQLTQRTGELPDKQDPFPQPYLNVQVENALVDRILELFNATKLTSHQAKLLLDRVRVLIELGERVASKTAH
jgi:hypothetical protein